MYRAKLGKVPFARFIQNLDEGQDHMRLAEELREAIDLDSWYCTISLSSTSAPRTSRPSRL